VSSRETPLTSAAPLAVETGDSLSSTLSDELGRAESVSSEKDRPSLTIITGEGVGTLIRLSASELVFGRGKNCLALMDPGLSRRHARFIWVDRQAYVEDLGSTNGTSVRGARITAPVRLEDGDHVRIGDHVLRYSLYSAQEEEAALQLYESSVRDEASGAFNRRYFDTQLALALTLARENDEPLSLLLMDIDGFKAINDSHGHVVGDVVLRVLVASINRFAKPGELVARYGGDEIVVLCPRTSVRNALILAERIRSTVERLPFSARDNTFEVTISVGVAATPEATAHGLALLDAADRALHQAKVAGRNRVVAALSTQSTGHLALDTH
jgi:two-component system cell cycle response regulator